MSKATKRKHVTKEVMDEFVLPDAERRVVKVLAGRGNNLHEVETHSGETFLASMPTKFRKNVWIKRGDFVMVEPIDEGDKVKAEITHILYKEQIKFIKEEKLWPVRFDVQPKNNTSKDCMIPDDMLPPSDDDDDDESNDENEENRYEHSNRISNPNRRVQILADDDDSDSDEEDDEECR